MKKKLIALFAACSMITTAVVGLIQTAYAATPNVRIEVTDGATDTQKVLTFYYEGVNGLYTVDGTLSFTGGAVTINSASVTIANDYQVASTVNGKIGFSCFDDPTSSADGSFATATITVPGDVDITANYQLKNFVDENDVDHKNSIGTVSVTIKAKTEEPDPVNIEKQNKNGVITGTDEYASQKADIYGVEVTPVDQKAITGATVTFDGQDPQEYRTGTTITEGSIIFAVILVSESGAELPPLEKANVTPIFAD